MNKRSATITAVIFGAINILIFTLLKGEAAAPLPIFIIGSASIYILTVESEKKKKTDNGEREDMANYKSLESFYKLTGNISILLAFVGLITGMLVGYKPENFVSDLVVSLIWNFPRFYFGYKLIKQNRSTVNTALKISKGMFIYSIVVAVINFLPVLLGSFDNLMVGWLYYILIYLYYKSYKISADYIKNSHQKDMKEIRSVNNVSKSNLSKFSSTYVLLIVVLGLGIFSGYLLNQSNKNTSKAIKPEFSNIGKTCNFEISEINQYKKGGDAEGLEKLEYEYENNQDDGNAFNKYFLNSLEREIWEYKNYRWFYYDGLIRNNSDKEQYLININAKIRTDNNIFIDEGWSERMNRWLAPGEAIPFKVTIKVDSEDLVNKYVDNEEYELKTNFYPWFDTCTY
ncbi:MAG: hypothetical protein R3B92_04145 [Patescibacteria group bacterium]